MERLTILRAMGRNLAEVASLQTSGRVVETSAHRLHGLVHASVLTLLSPTDRAFGERVLPPPNPTKPMIAMHLHVCGADARGLLARMLKPAAAAGIFINRLDFGLVGYDVGGARYRFALDLDISVPDSFVGSPASMFAKNALPTDHIAVHDATGTLLWLVGEAGTCAETSPATGYRTCLVVTMSNDVNGVAYEFTNLLAHCGLNIRAARGHHHYGRFLQSFVVQGSDHALRELRARIDRDDVRAKFSPIVAEQPHRQYQPPNDTTWYEVVGTHDDHVPTLQAIHALFGRGLKLLCPFVELYVAPFTGSVMCERVVFGVTKAISPSEMKRMWRAYQPLRRTDFELYSMKEPQFMANTVRAFDPFAGFTHVKMG